MFHIKTSKQINDLYFALLVAESHDEFFEDRNQCSHLHCYFAQERQRGRNGVRFFLKHPSLDVRLMTQLTLFHEGIWFLLTLGGLLTEKNLRPILGMLVAVGRPGLAAGLLSPTLNWHTVQASKEEMKRLKQQGKFVKRKP